MESTYSHYGHNLFELLMFQYSSDSPQVKQNMVSCITILVQKLPHELPHDLSLGFQEIKKYQKNFKFSLKPSLPSSNQTMAITVKKNEKEDIKLYLSSPIYWMSLFCFKYFNRLALLVQRKEKHLYIRECNNILRNEVPGNSNLFKVTKNIQH